MRFAMGRWAIAVAAAVSLAVIRCGSDESVLPRADASAEPDASQDAALPQEAAADGGGGDSGSLDATPDVDATETAPAADAADDADSAPPSVFELLNHVTLPGSGAVLSISVRGELAVLGRALSDGPELVVVRL